MNSVFRQRLWKLQLLLGLMQLDLGSIRSKKNLSYCIFLKKNFLVYISTVAIVIPKVCVEGTELHPTSTHFSCCISKETASVSANLELINLFLENFFYNFVQNNFLFTYENPNKLNSSIPIKLNLR